SKCSGPGGDPGSSLGHKYAPMTAHGNAGGQIVWDCVERRDMAIGELFERLEKDLRLLSDPNAGVQGHV
ncbi:MAG: hypothetical protein ACLPKW_27525, partial [Acetobacteraceae bacterium]